MSGSRYDSHDVLNQPPPLGDVDLFTMDGVLTAGTARLDAEWAADRLRDFGRELGRSETRALGDAANRNPPVLRTHDRFGHRIDQVEFHPAWHRLMALGVAHRVHDLPWAEERPGSQVARSALLYLLTQVESGVTCPLSMTFAGVPALRREPAVAETWVPRLLSDRYDPRPLPPERKNGCLLGMAMTEKQGGSDVRANTTRAVAAGEHGKQAVYRLTGHKWFCSAPMCDAFLTLAQLEEGLTCFLVPRRLPDGEPNRFFLQRLKDKLGNRSNASSEIEYHDTWAVRVGDPGRGIATILEMVQHTRLDCVAGSAGLMRRAVQQALHHCRHRRAFGRPLAEQPLMASVLADLVLESQAAAWSMLRLAAAYDRAATDERARAFARLATAVLKFWICKRGPAVVGEALECLGGNGYVEESILPRLYREAPLLSIWEGSGNVMCLDVLRAIGREPDALPALFEELAPAVEASGEIRALAASLRTDLESGAWRQERAARMLVSRLALLIQASFLVMDAEPEIAAGFVRARLGDPIAGAAAAPFGALPGDLDVERIVAAG